MKQPCVHECVCGMAHFCPDNKSCEHYTPSLLPVLHRYRMICLERSNRLKNKSEISKAAILIGKCEAIRKIIAHMEREK